MAGTRNPTDRQSRLDLGMSLGLWDTRVLLVSGLIRVYLVGLALHALAAGAAMRAAAWAFHARHRSGR